MVAIIPAHGRGTSLKARFRPTIRFFYVLFIILGLASFFMMGRLIGKMIREHQEEQEPAETTWDDFSKMDMYEIRDALRCHTRNRDDSKQITTAEDWQFMRLKMREHVDGTAPLEDVVPPTLGYTLNGIGGGPPPYEVGYSDGKGRGLFATRDIRKGELVHDAAKSDVIFKDGISFKKYIWSLHIASSKHSMLACDTLYWCDTMEIDGQFKIMLGTNISVFMNSGDPANTIPNTATSLAMYATRDIKKGDEILTDYGVYPTKWDEVGL